VRLAAAVAVLAAAPLLVGGLAADLPGGGDAPALGWCFAGTLQVLVAGVPALWVALGSPGASLRERLGELVLLGAVSAPPLTLAWPVAAVRPGAAAGALAYAALVLLAVAAWSRWGRPATAPARTAVALGLTGGLTVLATLWGEVSATPPSVLAWAAPPLALGAVLGGAGLGAPLGGLAALVAAGIGGPLAVRRVAAARRRRLAAAAVGAAALLLVATGPAAAATVVSVRALLGGRIRPEEPFPLAVELRGAEAGAEVGARTFGYRWSVPAEGGARVDLPATPLGGSYRLELGLRPAGDEAWRRLEAAPPPAVPVDADTLLVGLVGDASRPVAAALVGDRDAELVALEAADLPLVARAGEALDVVVAGRGAAASDLAAGYLRAWAAGGGTLVVDDAASLSHVAGDLGAAGPTAPGWSVRRIGAGAVVGPGGGPRLSDRAELAAPPGVAVVAARTARRDRRREVVQLALAAPAPGPSPALGRRLGLAALAAAVAFVLLAGARTRVAAGPFVGGAALVGLATALLLRAVVAPAAGVYADSRVVLEAPVGGRAARRLEVVRAAAAHPTEATLALPAGGVPRPVFASPVSAVRSRGHVALVGGERAELRLPLAGFPKAFLRLDAVALAGPLEVEPLGGGRLRLANGSGRDLEAVALLTAAGVHPVGALAAGARTEVRLGEPTPRDRWLAAPADRSELDRRRLVAAAVPRVAPDEVVLVGWAPPRPRVAAGATEERARRALVVVR